MSLGPLINGRRYSFSSIELTLSTLTKPLELFQDITDISYGETLDIGMVRGTSRGPIGWTAGNYEATDGSITMGKSSAQALIDSIGPGWLGINMNCLINFSDIGEITPTEHELVCRLAGLEDDHSYGPDALYSKFTLKVFYVIRNGIPPVFNRVI